MACIVKLRWVLQPVVLMFFLINLQTFAIFALVCENLQIWPSAEKSCQYFQIGHNVWTRVEHCDYSICLRGWPDSKVQIVQYYGKNSNKINYVNERYIVFLSLNWEWSTLRFQLTLLYCLIHKLIGRSNVLKSMQLAFMWSFD